MAVTSRMRLLLTGLALVTAVAVPVALPAPASGAAAPRVRDGGPPQVGGLGVLAGSLHDHTTDSDGDAPSSVVGAFVRTHAAELGLDFFSLTDHSDFFPVATQPPSGSAPLAPTPWQRSLAVAQANTTPTFAVLRGFEWTNDQQNHLNVIGSGNWTSRALTGDVALSMAPFWEWLGGPTVEDPSGLGVGTGPGTGIGQFNHPSSKGPLNWDDYAYDAEAARVMATIEVREGARGWYWFALAKGWTVGPVMNADYHPWMANGVLANATPGAGCGQRTFYDCERSLVVTDGGSPEDVMEGLRARRTAAADRPDLWATLRGPGGVWMGSAVGAAPGSELTLTVDAGTQESALTGVEIVRDGTLADFTHFYGANGPCLPADPTRDPRPGCSQHLPGYEEQRRRFAASNGQATPKKSIDAPPPGTGAATASLAGQRATVDVPVVVPTTPSTRPDGRHFFYAIVTRADGSRVVTAPVFTADVAAPVVPEVPAVPWLVATAVALLGLALAAARRPSRSVAGAAGAAAVGVEDHHVRWHDADRGLT